MNAIMLFNARNLVEILEILVVDEIYLWNIRAQNVEKKKIESQVLTWTANIKKITGEQSF